MRTSARILFAAVAGLLLSLLTLVPVAPVTQANAPIGPLDLSGEMEGDGDGEGGAGVSSTTATGVFGDACVCSVFLPELRKRKAPTMLRITTATGIKINFRFLRRGLVADSISESATTTRGV